MESKKTISPKRKMPERRAKSKKAKSDGIDFVEGFHPPSREDSIKAIWCDPMIPEYDPADADDFVFFEPLPEPTSIDDWLAQYCDRGQQFMHYLHGSSWFSKTKGNRMKQTFHPSGANIREKYPDGKIYLVPLGEFGGENDVELGHLVDYTERFLGIPTSVLKGVKVNIDKGNIYWTDDRKSDLHPDMEHKDVVTLHRDDMLTTRFDEETGHIQLRVDSPLYILQEVLPDDALCAIGLTMLDLYSDEPDLFVAGMAKGNSRVAVFSFHRYDPCLKFSQEFWYDIHKTRKMEEEKRKRLLLQRSCKLLVHEISHLLGVAHCIYYQCCMNGSGHLEEDFRQPMHLCPVDLHKLQALVGFDILVRYRNLYEFYTKHKFTEEAKWMTKRMEMIPERKEEDDGKHD